MGGVAAGRSRLGESSGGRAAVLESIPFVDKSSRQALELRHRAEFVELERGEDFQSEGTRPQADGERSGGEVHRDGRSRSQAAD